MPGCKQDLQLSFEFFPPKTEKMFNNLMAALDRLVALHPRFVSVTYGAGGSTREKTHDIVTHIKEETGVPAAAHLTCVGETRANIDAIARRYWDAGIRHIVALRGDAPEDVDHYEPHPEGYAYAVDLIEGLKKVADFEISVGCYPEVHPEALSPEADLDNFKRKMDAGATRAISQFFFDNETFFRFFERARAAGIDAEITPGILPVGNFEKMLSFAGSCGAIVPPWVHERFGRCVGMPDSLFETAVDLAATQCAELRAQGFDTLHVYTLNRSDLTLEILKRLGIEPGRPEMAPGPGVDTPLAAVGSAA